MMHSPKIDELILALNTELRYYAEKVMLLETDEEIDSFVNGYIECIAIGDRNPSSLHQVALLEFHISELQKAIDSNV